MHEVHARAEDPLGENPARDARCTGCGGREELVGDALDGMVVNDVAHLVPHHAGDLVFVEVAELEQRSGQVDEAARQCEGAGLFSPESARLASGAACW